MANFENISGTESIAREQGTKPESDWDKQIFEAGLAKVKERYPGLREQIQISIRTPQIGEHHNEGPVMEAHLTLILKTIMDIKDGIFHQDIKSPELRQILQSVVLRYEDAQVSLNPDIIDYTFLHDIAKPDSMTLKFKENKEGVEITWAQWEAIEAAGQPYMFEGKEVTSISYFHKSEGSKGTHGNKGAEMMKGHGVPDGILAAIAKHEVAYQFAKISALTYEEHFIKSGFSEAQQNFILAGSYIDSMASIGKSGQPEMYNYMNLVYSKLNYDLIKKYLDAGAVFRENDLRALKKKDKVLTTEDIEAIL